MSAVNIPWAALVALGSAVAAIITALWAKLRAVEVERKDWIDRWAAEVKRSPQDDPQEWEEKTDIRNRRKDILEQFEEEKKRRRKEEDDRLRAYVDGQSTPPRFRR
jgi:hypothetical protein